MQQILALFQVILELGFKCDHSFSLGVNIADEYSSIELAVFK